MGFEVAIAQADAQVRDKKIRRDVAQAMGGSSAFVALTPVGPPRLWRTISDATLNAFERSIGGAPPTPATAQQAIAAAASALDTLRGQLVEPHLLIDARIGVVLTLAEGVFCALTEGVRLYRARGGVPERMHAKAQRPAGISAGTLFTTVETSHSGDLFILGTRDAFTVRAIGNLATALGKGTHAAVSELCDAVISPCREGGVGAATVVLRAS